MLVLQIPVGVSRLIRRGAEIISSIDKNIKKYERVYWVSEEEIGIIFYERNDKPETDFVETVIRRKLTTEIKEPDASNFLENINFGMVHINSGDELFAIESRAKIKILREQSNSGPKSIATEKKKEETQGEGMKNELATTSK